MQAPIKNAHPYTINNWAEHRTDQGSYQEPFLYAITAGQRNGESLTFHFQVGENEFRQCHIDTVGKTLCYLYCSSNNKKGKQSGDSPAVSVSGA